MKGSFSIPSSFLRRRREPDPVEDPTLYKIRAREQDFEGRILFQDNRLMIVKTVDLKVIKILKASIQKIK